MPQGITRRRMLVAGAAGLASFAGCAGDFLGGDGGAADPDRVLKLGVLAPLSGSLEAFGNEFQDATELVQKQINQADNKFGVELTVEDTESDPETALDAAQSLVEDGNKAIVGPGTSEAARRITEEVLVPESAIACSPLAIDPAGDVEDEDLMFQITPTQQQLGEAFSRATALEEVGSIAVLHEANVYGRTTSAETKDKANLRGISTTQTVSLDPGAGSYTSELESAVADDPDGLVVVAGPATGTQLLQNYYAEFGDRPVFLSDRLRLPSLPDEVDSDMETAIVVATQPVWNRGGGFGETATATATTTGEGETETVNVHRAFFDAFRAQYDRAPLIQTAQAFDAAVTLLLGTIAAGPDSYTGPKIRDVLRKTVSQQPGYDTFRTLSGKDYWEDLGAIADGVRATYAGATNNINFNEAGAVGNWNLEASEFAPDTETGFNSLIPIPIGGVHDPN